MWPAVPVCPCPRLKAVSLSSALQHADCQSWQTRHAHPDASSSNNPHTHTDKLPSPSLPPSSLPKQPKTQQLPWKQCKPTATQRHRHGAFREEEEVEENVYVSVWVASALNLSLEVQAGEGWVHLWSVGPMVKRMSCSKSLTAPNLTPVKVSAVQMDTLIVRQIAVVLWWYYWEQLSIGK